jgi:hypothetical protein
MPPKSEPAASSAAKAPESSDSKAPKAPAPTATAASTPVSDSSPVPPPSNSPQSEAILIEILREIRGVKENYSHLDSRIEAVSHQMHQSVQNAFPDQSPMSSSFREPHNRQSLGSYHSSASQELTIRKSSFRLEKPKFEAPKDTKLDGSLDEATIKFFDECDRHIEIWKAMPENIEKTFEGSENFAIVSLPPAVQKKLAHSLDFIFSTAELCMWTEEEIEKAKFWKKVTTSQVRKLILERKAQGVSLLSAISTIQPPNIAWPHGVGFIHSEAFQEYKDKFITQVSQISEGGIQLPLVSIKDAIISAIPDNKFKAELYSNFGHAGSTPGPLASGHSRELSIKSIFDFIHDHIVTIKKKGLAGLVNTRSVTFPTFSTPSTVQKSVGRRPFPARAVQSIEFQKADFPETDRQFWESSDRQVFEPSDCQQSLSDEECTFVNTAVQKAQSKDCRHVGIGPDGKLLCPWLGKPDTAKCGFRHPSNELALRGKGISTSKKVHQIVGLGAGLGISHSEDEEKAADHNDL